jgi:ABC-type sulfate/molybdate transport systems ATPase subunit
MSLAVDFVTNAPVRVRATMRCEAGRTVGLVGPSGAGKSTVLRAIAGLLPSEGTLEVGGISWQGVPTFRRSVGLVAQRSNLLPHLSAIQNVAMSVSEQGPPAKERAARWIARVNMAGLENRFPHELSGGQQQRIAIARALAREPQVLLLDEPFSSVDATTRRRLYEELQVLRADLKCATVLVTHDVKEAALLSDELCVIADQTTLMQAPTAQALEQPASGRVAQLLGWRNVIPAAKWKQSLALCSQYVPDHVGQGFVLVPHRTVRIDLRAGAPGLPAQIDSVLSLPHQAWAVAKLDGVRIWGQLVTRGSSRPDPGTACFVGFEPEKIRITQI